VGARAGIDSCCWRMGRGRRQTGDVSKGTSAPGRSLANGKTAGGSPIWDRDTRRAFHAGWCGLPGDGSGAGNQISGTRPAANRLGGLHRIGSLGGGLFDGTETTAARIALYGNDGGGHRPPLQMQCKSKQELVELFPAGRQDCLWGSLSWPRRWFCGSGVWQLTCPFAASIAVDRDSAPGGWRFADGPGYGAALARRRRASP